MAGLERPQELWGKEEAFTAAQRQAGSSTAPGCSYLLLDVVQSPSLSTAGILPLPRAAGGAQPHSQLDWRLLPAQVPPFPLLPAQSPGAGRQAPAPGNPVTHGRQRCSGSNTATFSSKGMSCFGYLSTRKALHLRSLLSLHEARVTRLGPAHAAPSALAGSEMPLPHVQLPVPWGLRCSLGCVGQEKTPQSNSGAKPAA